MPLISLLMPVDYGPDPGIIKGDFKTIMGKAQFDNSCGISCLDASLQYLFLIQK